MKILFTGTYSTGKSTLIREFIKRHTEYKFYIINEKAREVLEQGYPLGKDANIDSYLFYINEQLKAEIKSLDYKYDILIADRSIIDGVAHPIVNKSLTRPYLNNYFIEMFENILYFQKDFYDIYIYFPIEFNIEKDELRPNDEEYRYKIDNQIKILLDKYNIIYHTVTGTVDERCTQLNQIIKEYGMR